MKSLQATPQQVTLLFAAGVLSEILMMRFIGKWSDTHGRKPALLFALGIMPVRLLLYLVVAHPVGVIAVQLMHGLNFGIVGTVAVAYANDCARNGGRGMAQAQMALTGSLASALGPLFAGLLVEGIGFVGMFVVMAAVGAVGILLLLPVEETCSPGGGKQV
jgi:MFS family permease